MYRFDEDMSEADSTVSSGKKPVRERLLKKIKSLDFISLLIAISAAALIFIFSGRISEKLGVGVTATDPAYAWVTVMMESGDAGNEEKLITGWGTEASKTDLFPDGRVNINSDDPEVLKRLPGIGEKIASAIIEYRYEHGDFDSIEELKNVEGIGEKKFDAIKELITVG